MSEFNPLKLLYFPDPILKKVCEPVADIFDVQALAHDMILTMMVEGGVGLAAPQVGHAIRLFVVDVDWVKDRENPIEAANPYIFINPTVRLSPGEVEVNERCLSFPGEGMPTKRARAVEVEATGIDGEPFTLHAEGLLAIAIQHEADHLDGKTLGDRMGEMRKMMVRKNIAKKIRGK
jgi:peptide deformylase